MRSEQLSSRNYDTDKYQYLKRYDPIFSQFVNENITLLELGVFRGGSLLMWRDYFSRGNIVGIDINLPKDFLPQDRICVFEGSQTDLMFLSDVSSKTAPNGFDIIIDDASHIGELSKKSFWHLFDNHLKPGGIYVIEDWGTGYWDNWPDGCALDLNNNSKFKDSEVISKDPMPCHSYGMVGFVKQLVDEIGASDVTKFQANNYRRESKFDSMMIFPYVIFIKKSG